MGAYLKGEKLEFDKRQYRVLHDESTQKELILSTVNPTRAYITFGLQEATYYTFTLSLDNIRVSEDIYFSDLSALTEDTLNTSLLRFDETYLCYYGPYQSDSNTYKMYVLKLSEYPGTINISFSYDSTNKVILVTVSLINQSLLPEPIGFWGGIWGVLKYNERLVVYTSADAVQFGTTDATTYRTGLGNYSTDDGSVTLPMFNTTSSSTAPVSTVFEKIVETPYVVSDETDVPSSSYTQCVFLAYYWIYGTDISGSPTLSELTGKPMKGLSADFLGSPKTISMSVYNRRIDNV